MQHLAGAAILVLAACHTSVLTSQVCFRELKSRVMIIQVDALANTTGAAVVLAGHFAKGNASAMGTIDRISGSGVFARDPDSLVIFTNRTTHPKPPPKSGRHRHLKPQILRQRRRSKTHIKRTRP